MKLFRSLEDNHNNFNYKENINAGYVNYNRQFKGIMVQAGLRVENTHSKGHSIGFRYDYDARKMLRSILYWTEIIPIFSQVQLLRSIKTQ